MIRQIAAIDLKRGIATDSGIPWKLPGDSAYFRDKTESGLIVMGRGTYVEFAAPLHDRVNYVLTSGTETLRDGFQSIAALAELQSDHPDEDIWIIGGAYVYASTIEQSDELLITQVLGDFECTKFFPDYRDRFSRVGQSDEHRDRDVAYRFETWEHDG